MPDCIWNDTYKDVVTTTTNGVVEIVDRYTQQMWRETKSHSATKVVERNRAGERECRTITKSQPYTRTCFEYCYRVYQPKRKKRSVASKVGIGALVVGVGGLAFLSGGALGLFGPAILHAVVGTAGGMTASGTLGVAASTLAAGPGGIGMIKGTPRGFEKGPHKSDRGPERLELEWQKDGREFIEEGPWERCPQ